MEPIAHIPIDSLRRGAEPARDCCANCKFFNPNPPDPRNLKAPPAGSCRRFPPVPQITGMQQSPNGGPAVMQIQRTFPPVFGMEWCGEHSRLQ